MTNTPTEAEIADILIRLDEVDSDVQWGTQRSAADLIERLVAERDAYRALDARQDKGNVELVHRADKAEAALAEARRVIKPFAKFARGWTNPTDYASEHAVYQRGRAIYVGDLRAVADWLAKQDAVPRTHVIVPKEPTAAMLNAGDTAFEGGYIREVYDAMIAAAPDAKP